MVFMAVAGSKCGMDMDGQPYAYNTFRNSLDLFSLLYFASFYVSPFARPKFHFWLLIENFLPFILASVAGYSLHLGKHEDGLEKIPSRCLPRSINNLNNLQTSVFN
jgi:hypothetical protein